MGSTPTLVTDDRVVQRRRRLRDMQENDGSIPSAVTFETIRSVSVAAARVCGMDEDRVQFPGGPLSEMGWHVPRGRLIFARSVRRVRFPFGPLKLTEGQSDGRRYPVASRASILMVP